MLTDPLADMLTRIRNAHKAKFDTVEMPTPPEGQRGKAAETTLPQGRGHELRDESDREEGCRREGSTMMICYCESPCRPWRKRCAPSADRVRKKVNRAIQHVPAQCFSKRQAYVRPDHRSCSGQTQVAASTPEPRAEGNAQGYQQPGSGRAVSCWRGNAWRGGSPGWSSAQRFFTAG